jgi:hypothetical protein
MDVQSKQIGAADFDLELTPKFTLPVGVWQTEVRVKVVLENGLVVEPGDLIVRLEIVPDVEAVPRQLYFGKCVSGVARGDGIALVSASGRPFRVMSHRVEGTAVKIEAVDGADAGASVQTFSVSTSASTLGLQRAKVLFQIKSDDGKVNEIAVPVVFEACE